MAELRLLNEFGISNVILALEPGGPCACHCTYCFAELNRKAGNKGKGRRDDDPGTFESTIERAYGPNYDPTHFLQWSIRNRMTLGWSNTTEPFQDTGQAAGILKICDALGLPLFIQTKGLNFDFALPYLRSMARNVVLFVSFPTDDDRAIRRFELGCPKAAERYAVIRQAADAGITVVLALAPYHEDWCADVAAHARRGLDAGAKHVFLDRLHLNRRQRESATDSVMVGLATQEVKTKYLLDMVAIQDTAAERDATFYANGYFPATMGFPNTTESLVPPEFPAKGRRWGYHAKRIYHGLDFDCQIESLTPPIVVEWGEVQAAMERDGGAVSQPFSYTTMGRLLAVKTLAAAWRSTLAPTATVATYLRAVWNSPSPSNVFWRHPHARLALRPDGTPWRSDGGDVVLLYDPQWTGPGLSRTVESLQPFRRYHANEMEILTDAQR